MPNGEDVIGYKKLGPPLLLLVHTQVLILGRPWDKAISTLLLVSFDCTASVLDLESNLAGPRQICNVDLTSLCTMSLKLRRQIGDPKTLCFYSI